MKSKRLNLKEAKNLVWLTWFEFVLIGVIVYFFTNPMHVAIFVAAPIALHALINFWVKSEGVPVRLFSVVPTVFLPTAFITGIGALMLALVYDTIWNSGSIALAVVCIMCIMVVYPESKYADYDWNIHILEWKNPSRYHVVDSFFK